jgi:hypothetical protein
MTGQEKNDKKKRLLNRGDCMDRFDCIVTVSSIGGGNLSTQRLDYSWFYAAQISKCVNNRQLVENVRLITYY